MTDPQQIAEIQRMGREVAKLSARVATLEQQGTVVAKLEEIHETLKPAAEYAKNILAVQSGAVGVRP
jgi:predicted transcriptional regulator